MIIDATMISTFRSCEEKYRLRMKELWTSKTNNGAIGSGLAFHEGGAIYRKLRKAGKSVEESYNGGLYILRQSYAREMPPAFTDQFAPCPDERRSLPNLERIFEAWCQYEALQNYTYHYIEESGGLILGTIERKDKIVDIIYSIIIDAVVEQQGCLFVDDIKTTTMYITQALKDSYRLSQQIRGYVVGAAELLRKEIYGGLISLVWFQKQPKTSGKAVSEYFHSVPVTFSPEQLSEWRDNTLLTVNRILDCEESNQWQKDFGDSCKSYNGCTFKEVCWSNPSSREPILKMDFEKATWTPLEAIRSRKIMLDEV
jgi:hypothetical protein